MQTDLFSKFFFRQKKTLNWLFVSAAHDMLYPLRAATRACSGRELGGCKCSCRRVLWLARWRRAVFGFGLPAAGLPLADWRLAQEWTWQTQPKRRHGRQPAALPERQLGDSWFPCCAWAPGRPGRSAAGAAAVSAAAGAAAVSAAAERALSVLQLLWAASGVLAGALVAGSDLTLGGRGTQHAGQLRQGCAHAVQRFSRRHHRHGHSGHHHLHCEERRLLRVQQLRRGHAVPFVLDWQRPRCRLGGCVP
jgi:hypothetical protein